MTTEQDISRWLQLFKQPKASELDASKIKQICYILELSQKIPHISVCHTKVKKNGQFSQPTGANISQLLSVKPDYLTMADLAALAALNTSSYLRNKPITLPLTVQSKKLLETLIATGRFFFNTVSNPSLKGGPSIEVEFLWKMDEYGNQSLSTKNENLKLFLLNTTMYVDHKNYTIGEITSAEEPQILTKLLQAPPLAPNAIAAVHKNLPTVNKSLLPIIINDIKQIRPEPKMFLRASGIDDIQFFRINVPNEIGYIEVFFIYDDMLIDPESTLVSFFKQCNGIVSEIKRDVEAEKKLLLRFEQVTKLVSLLRVRERHSYFMRSNNPKVMSAYTVFNLQSPNFKNIEQDWHACIEKIKAEGWSIELAPSFPYMIVHTVEDWIASVEENENDWFSINLGVRVNGRRFDLLPLLQEMLKDDFIFEDLEDMDDMDFNVAFPDGTVVTLDPARIKMMLTFVKELYDRVSDGQLKISKVDSAFFMEFSAATQALGLRWMGDTRLKKLGERLKNFQGILPAVVPKTFAATLRQYQQEGVNWLQFLREYELGGILADDMGLGKTVQGLAHIAIEKAAGRLEGKPILVIAPTSVLPNWLLEAKRFTPHLKVIALRAGMQRKSLLEELKTADIVLSTYALVVRDKDDLLKHAFHTIILDEAQFIKNSKAQVTQVVNQLHADHRLCLTGTPLENHLGELWSLFNFLMPGFLGTEKTFNAIYRHPIEKRQNTAMRQSLMRRIQPFMLRRTKDKVATELPHKTEIIQMCELDAEQADLYETIRVSMHDKVTQEIANKGLARSHIVLLDALLKLRQVCCHPQLLKMDAAKAIKTSVKLEQLMTMVPEMIEEGRRIVLFSQFTSMLSLIEDAFSKEKIRYVKITGSTKDRLAPIESFQNGDVPVILISLKAGGTGINLTAADTVIHFDPWWNPAVEQQATDRVYRIGQDKPVFVYKMLTSATVEEKILLMQQKKAALAASIFNPEVQTGGSLMVAEINSLFEPLGK